MEPEYRRRLIVGVAMLALFLLVAYAVLAFIAVLVLTIFLYYAVRPIFKFLRRFGLRQRVRAALSLVLFGIPFLVLIAYTVAILAIELQNFLREFDAAPEQITSELNIAGLDLEALEQLISQQGSEIDPGLIVDTALGAVGFAGALFVQLLLIVLGTYYLLVDGPRLREYLLSQYDKSGIGATYLREVDHELSLALFGNIVNVFITAIVGITTFYAFNILTPAAANIPFPAVLGALAGIGSLIPVIGIKLVYVPLCGGLAINAWLTGQPELLLPIAILFVVSGVFVDFIPDLVIRAQVSSDNTHTGLLLIAYVVGPAVFGFYGLFLAPIVLVCATNAVTVLLPYVLSGPADGQTTLDSFASTDTSGHDAEGDS